MSQSRNEGDAGGDAADKVTESAFQNLREKIEGNLKKSEAAKKKNIESKSAGKKQGAQKELPEGRGKKRKLDGQIKETPAPSKKASTAKDNVDLKSIMAELGGTEEDLDLIDGIDSDSEVEGHDTQPIKTSQPDSKKGKTLESGMANILKEIALVRDTYAGDESDEEEIDKVKRTADSVRAQADDKPVEEMKFKSAATEVQKDNNKKSKLRFPARPDWFAVESAPVEEREAKYDISASARDLLHTHGKSLLDAENAAFKTTQQSSSSQSFYNTVIASGTLSDKVSALTLAVQESPLHNTRALESLIGLAKKRSRSQAVDVLRALKDLFAQGSLLPTDRKLHAFAAQPRLLAALGQVKSWTAGEHLPANITEQDLIMWTFEDWLKEQYFEVLKVLETWCNDEIEFAKTRATTYVYELLREKPEQEANLLRLLINKLGDPVKKIASQASYLIMQLLATHPAMKEIVISAIDTDFIFKPGQSMHARYYAAVTLNQTALSVNEDKLAIKLLDIYFGLFKLLLRPGEEQVKPKSEIIPKAHKRQRQEAAALPSTDQEDDLREKLVSAVLTGVNRAYPYAGSDHKHFDEHLDTLFQVTHSANFNTSIQAMLLIQQLVANTSISSDRFYRVLYESLHDPRLIASSKQQLYLNLLHRSLKADLSQKRIKAFAKRILQILSVHEPSFICGAFFLLKDLEKTFPSLASMLDQPEDHDEEEEIFRDVDADSEIKSTQLVSAEAVYDGMKRDPAHANADTSCMWDVLPYLSHYHPSVTVSADHILDHKILPGQPDLNLHTLIHFLDRFVYKNAKLSAATKLRGSSIMQPMANDDTKAVLVSSGARSRNLPVNSAEFLARKSDDIAAEDVFFHKYFKTMGKSATRKIKKASKEEDENMESDNEDEIWQAMVNNGPDLEGLGADDDDDEISDMEGFAEAMDDDEDSGLEEEDSNVEMQNGGDDDGSVDIEAGIFDDSDEDESAADSANDDQSESEFGGLSEDERKESKPSKKTIQKREDRERKKKLKALPTFASVDDWAKALEDDADEDLG